MNMMGIFISDRLGIALKAVQSILHHFILTSLSLFTTNLLADAVGFSWRALNCYGSHLPKIKGKASNQPGAGIGRGAEIRGVIKLMCSVARCFLVDALGLQTGCGFGGSGSACWALGVRMGTAS